MRESSRFSPLLTDEYSCHRTNGNGKSGIMATIYLDKQSNNWKLKTTVAGKDKRILLRKALAGEHNLVKPPDVVDLAERHTPVFSNQNQNQQVTVPIAAYQPNGDSSLLSFIDWFHVECS